MPFLNFRIIPNQFVQIHATLKRRQSFIEEYVNLALSSPKKFYEEKKWNVQGGL
jgi:hypothetical protein